MNCIEFAREYINGKRFKIERETESMIEFKYQMHIMHLWENESDEDFVCIALTNFTDVTPENIGLIKEMCSEMTAKLKQVKMYLMNNTIMATAEVYFRNQEDFNFQADIALRNLIASKVAYLELEKKNLP